jgi:PIN domain nuclease of toxin-antitoxin system
VSRRNRERREQNRQRRLAGEERVKKVQADVLLAAFLRAHGREKVAAQLDAASTSNADIAKAYAEDTDRVYPTADEAARRALRRSTHRAALAALEAFEG